MNNNKKSQQSKATLFNHWQWAGMLITPVRLVSGWLFLSAFLRRVVLAPAKLDPGTAAYVGNKFNHFLPNALWIKPMLDYLLTHADLLYMFLLIFTIIEGLVGLALLSGLGTRLAGLGSALLSWGIMLGAGWLGSTCLDEWNIGVAGIAAGMVILLAGAGPWSLDNWWQKRWPSLAKHPLLRWLSSGPLWSEQDSSKKTVRLALILSVLALGWTLYTNQAFAGGVWGKLHNLSKKPHLTLSRPLLNPNGSLELTLFRDQGPDTYGAFVVQIAVKDQSGKPVETFTSRDLAAIAPVAIENHYPVKTHAGSSSLVVPLGSLARIRLQPQQPLDLSPGSYQIEVTDISGLHWSVATKLE